MSTFSGDKKREFYETLMTSNGAREIIAIFRYVDHAEDHRVERKNRLAINKAECDQN